MTEKELDFEDLVEGPSDKELKLIGGLVERQAKLEDWIADQLARMNIAVERLRKLEYETLPEAMKAAGCESYTTAAGLIVNVKEDVKASIAVANVPWCHSWMRDHGHGALIRNEFKITYGVGEEENAKAKILSTTLKEQAQDFNQKEYVHPRTLPAFCRTEMENDEERDEPLLNEEWETKFGIYRYKRAKITRPG